MTTPAHTRQAREILGEGKLLAPVVMAVLGEQPADERRIARRWVELMLERPNYKNSMLREGFTQEDVDTISDRLVDGMLACGLESVRERIDAHLAAGADHVPVSFINDNSLTLYQPRALPREQWRQLATILD
jgi:probable F420-dependent oxidoreductase